MKYIISFLLLVVFCLNETVAQNARLYGYVQKSTDFASYFGGIEAILRDWLGQIE